MTEAQANQIISDLTTIIDALETLTLWVAGVVLGLGVLWGVQAWKIIQYAAKQKTPLALMMCCLLGFQANADCEMNTGVTSDDGQYYFTASVNQFEASGIEFMNVMQYAIRSSDGAQMSYRTHQIKHYPETGNVVHSWSAQNHLNSTIANSPPQGWYDWADTYGGSGLTGGLIEDTTWDIASRIGDTSYCSELLDEIVNGLPVDADGDGYYSDVDPDDNDASSQPTVNGWEYHGPGLTFEDSEGWTYTSYFFEDPTGKHFILYIRDNGEILGWKQVGYNDDGTAYTVDYGDGAYPGMPSHTEYDFEGSRSSTSSPNYASGGLDFERTDSTADPVDWPDDLAGVGDAIDALRISNFEAADDLYDMLREIARRESAGSAEIVDAIEAMQTGAGSATLDVGTLPDDGNPDPMSVDDLDDLESQGLVSPVSLIPEGSTGLGPYDLTLNLPGGATETLSVSLGAGSYIANIDDARLFMRYVILFGFVWSLTIKAVHELARV